MDQQIASHLHCQENQFSVEDCSKEGLTQISLKDIYRISSFKHRGVYLILWLLGAAFIRGQRL